MNSKTREAVQLMILAYKNKPRNQTSLIVSELWMEKGLSSWSLISLILRFKLSCVCQCYFVWNCEKVQSRLRNCPAMLHNGCIACVLSKYLYRKIFLSCLELKVILLFSSFAPKVWTAVAFTNTQMDLDNRKVLLSPKWLCKHRGGCQELSHNLSIDGKYAKKFLKTSNEMVVYIKSNDWDRTSETLSWNWNWNENETLFYERPELLMRIFRFWITIIFRFSNQWLFIRV